MTDQLQDESDIIDTRHQSQRHHQRARCPRPLYGHAGHHRSASASPATLVAKQQYDRESARANADIMAELADATGGTFFQNSNDLEKALKISPPCLKSITSWLSLRRT